MPRRKGDLTTVPAKSGARYRLWRSIRILRRFTISQLAATSGASVANITKYLLALRRAGYIRVDSPKRNGEKNGAAIYALARDTGPYPPRIREDGTIIDFNAAETRQGDCK